MSDDHISLVQCAQGGDSAGVNAALENGVAVDTTERGRTALHQAALGGHLDVTKVLLNWKADMGKKSKMDEDNGGTALHLAAEEGHTDVMKLLLDAGANVEALDIKGRRATHRAAARGQKESLELLKAYGADLNARDNGKATAVHHAAYSGDLTLVKWLVENGVYVVLKDKNGRLPKDVAKRYGHHEIHRYLKECNSKRGAFGTTKARKSMRDFSSLQRPGRIEHPSMPESLVIDAPKRISASSEPEEIGKHRDLTDAGSSQADLPAVDGTSLVSSTRKHSGEDTRHSEGSLTPPDSPPTHLEDSRVAPEPRRRTWSLRSSRGRSSLKGHLDELQEMKDRQEEELEWKNKEISQLKNGLGRLENEKMLLEEQMREMRLHVDHQQQKLVETASLHQKIEHLSLQNEEYQDKLRNTESSQADLLERDAANKHAVDALKREVERLTLQLRTSKENLLQTQEALSAAEIAAVSASRSDSLNKEVEHLTYMLNETGQRALSTQEKLEQKIAALKDQDEHNRQTIANLTKKVEELQDLNDVKKSTIAVLSEKLVEAETKARSDQVKLRVAEDRASTNQKHEGRLQQLEEQDAANKATIASLSTKLQQATQTNNDRDHKTLAVHKQQQNRIEELTEKDEANQKTISALTRNLNQLSLKLKENQENLVWYQGELQQKEREVSEREATTQEIIAKLRQEMEQLSQKLQESEQLKAPLSQYERGGTMVALQKQEAASKQTIKALQNRIQHLTNKLTDSEKASLDVQHEQLEKIASLKKEVEELKRNNSPANVQDADVRTMMEENLQKDLVIQALNTKVDELKEDLKKNFQNFSSWQAQQQEKDREIEQREAESHHTITSLRQQLDQLSQQLSRGQHQQQQLKGQEGKPAVNFSSLPEQVNHAAHTNTYQPRSFV
ncbi:ankycorbin isoform X1 [Procambarus clarkii]|uniref:ankycorbin isoform X1 n=1 Tax=Procambarus clarkii TaxID=6728 RepID=UPI003743B9E7